MSLGLAALWWVKDVVCANQGRPADLGKARRIQWDTNRVFSGRNLQIESDTDQGNKSLKGGKRRLFSVCQKKKLELQFRHNL